MDAGDEADEGFIFFEGFGDLRDGDAVEELGEDVAVSDRVGIEEILGDLGEVGGADFVGLNFLGEDGAEFLGELEMIWHVGEVQCGR